MGSACWVSPTSEPGLAGWGNPPTSKPGSAGWGDPPTSEPSGVARAEHSAQHSERKAQRICEGVEGPRKQPALAILWRGPQWRGLPLARVATITHSRVITGEVLEDKPNPPMCGQGCEPWATHSSVGRPNLMGAPSLSWDGSSWENRPSPSRQTRDPCQPRHDGSPPPTHLMKAVALTKSSRRRRDVLFDSRFTLL